MKIKYKVLGITLACTSGIIPITALATPNNITELLLQAASKRTATTANNLNILNETTVTFEYLNQTVNTAKVLNKKSKSTLEVTLDNNGNEVNIESLIASDNAIKKSRYGKLDIALFNKLAKHSKDAPIDIIIRMQDPNRRPLKRPSIEETKQRGRSEVDQEFNQRVQLEHARVAKVQAPLIRALNKMNLSEVKPDKSSAYISVKATPGQIKSLERRQDVKEIFSQAIYTAGMNNATDVVQSTATNNLGYTGTGIKVAVIERTGVMHEGVINGYSRNLDCPTVNNWSHATLVASILGRQHANYHGIAPGLSVLGGAACSFTDADLQTAYTWAKGEGTRIYNHSYWNFGGGLPSSLSKWIDQQTYTYWHTNVIIAGNDSNATAVGSPGVAYNAITVGALDDKNTVSRLDDTIWPKSNGLNPPSTYRDRQKPELVAPGVNIMSTAYFEKIAKMAFTAEPGVSGTSVAAPIVSASAALVLQREPYLSYYPEVIKPILIAATETYLNNSIGFDKIAGAGGVDTLLAFNMADGYLGGLNKSWANGYVTSSNNYSNAKYHAFNLTAGQFVKVALNWIVYDWADYNNRPSSDMDMQITGPSGNYIGGSYSWDSNTEYLSFYALQSGTYTVKVYPYRYDIPTGRTGYYGVAVSEQTVNNWQTF